MPTTRKRVMINLTKENEILLDSYITHYKEKMGVKLTYSQIINMCVFETFKESIERVRAKIQKETETKQED